MTAVIGTVGLALVLGGMVVGLFGIVQSLKSTADTAVGPRRTQHHLGWALMSGGAAMALGSFAWEDSLWLGILVAGSLALVTLREVLQLRR